MTDKPDPTRRRVMQATGAALASSAAIGGAAAQEGNETTTSSPSPTATPEGRAAESGLELELSPTTTLTSWEYDAGSWTIELESDTPTAVTVTDASEVAKALTEGDGAGSATAGYENFTRSAGESTLSFTGSMYEGMAAVTIAAAGGSELAVLRTDNLEAAGNGSVPFNGALLALLGSVAGTGFFTARKVAERQQADEETAERVK